MIIPALRLIKSSFPHAELTLVTNSSVSELAAVLKIADKIFSFDFPWTGQANKILGSMGCHKNAQKRKF